MSPRTFARPLESRPRILVAAVAVWTLLWGMVFGGSGSASSQRILDIPNADKLGHTVLYGCITALLVFGLGIIEEFRQRSIPTRNFDLGDIVANGIGVTVGWTVAYVLLIIWTHANARLD